MSCGKLSYVSKQEAMGVIRAIQRTARKYRHAQAMARRSPLHGREEAAVNDYERLNAYLDSPIRVAMPLNAAAYYGFFVELQRLANNLAVLHSLA